MPRFCREPADGQIPQASDCVAHRCPEHAALPPIDASADDGSECGLCVGMGLVNKYEAAFEKLVFWPLIESARDRLNLLAPGAGYAFEEEARTRITQAMNEDSEPVAPTVVE